MLGRALAHQFAALVRELDDEATAVVGGNGARDQALFLQGAEEGADGVFGDVAGLSQFGGGDARPIHFLCYVEMQEDAPTGARKPLGLHAGFEDGFVTGGDEFGQSGKLGACGVFYTKGGDDGLHFFRGDGFGFHDMCAC